MIQTATFTTTFFFLNYQTSEHTIDQGIIRALIKPKYNKESRGRGKLSFFVFSLNT